MQRISSESLPLGRVLVYRARKVRGAPLYSTDTTQRALRAEQMLQQGGARLGAKLRYGTVRVRVSLRLTVSCFSAAAFWLGAVSGASCSAGGSRRFAERFEDGYSRYCTIRVRASIIRNTVSYDTREWIHGTIRDFIRYAYRERHRAASADTKIGFVRYDYERDVRLRNDFFGNP